MPKVSILVPIYNVQDYLRECLESLVNQTLKDIEIICINDGSTDGSPAIIAEYATRDPRIKVINKPNTGYGDSMNMGLAAAAGEYLGIVESDDYIDRTMYADYVAIADQTGADLVKSNYYERTGKRDKRLNLYDSLKVPYGTPVDPHDYPNLITVRPSIWSALYRRNMLTENNIDFAPTPGASFQDTSFHFATWTSARTLVVLRKPYLHYRIDSAGSSKTSGEKVFAGCDEFDRATDYQRARGERDLRTFGPALGAMRYGCYVWHYNRIDPQYREQFAERWSREMKQLFEEGLVDETLFMPEALNDLHLLMADPHRFCEKHADHLEWTGFTYEHRRYREQPPAKRAFDIVRDEPVNPLVSVIMPIYKVEDYVRDALESLLAQTFKDFEVVCIDDGSPDGSVEVAKSAARGDARFRWLAQPNGGLSHARNTGINNSRGEYLMFLDSDDMLAPQALERMVARARKDDLDYLDYNVQTFYESARVRRVNNEDHFQQRSSIEGTMTGLELFVEVQKRDEYYCPAWLRFFKRDLLEEKSGEGDEMLAVRSQLRFKEGILHEDELFTPLLLARAQRAAYLNEPLYLRRMRKDSIMTSKRGVRNIAGVLAVTSELRNWLSDNQEKCDHATVLAWTKRIAFLHNIAVLDAANTDLQELEAYERTLDGRGLVDYELVVKGGLQVREQAAKDLDFRRMRKFGHTLLEGPRTFRDRLEDRLS